MKSSIKKYLILAMVIVAMVVTTVFVASAAPETITGRCSTHGIVSGQLKRIHEPTCEDIGYKIYGCNLCDYEFDTVFDVKPAAGHKLTKEEYILNGDHYELEATCTKCSDYTVKDLDNDFNPVKYYKVTLINKFATADTLDSYVFAKVATDWKEVKVAEEFFKEGEQFVEIGAVRDRDVDFGAYKFKGWAMGTEDPVETVTASATLNMADQTYYAVFEGVESVQYTVYFYSDAGYQVYPFGKEGLKVNHGDPINLDSATCEKADDAAYRYKFSKWVWSTNKTVEVKDDTILYGATGSGDELHLTAVFSKIPREYRFTYFYKDGKTPIVVNGSDAEDTITLGTFDNGLKLEAVNAQLFDNRSALDFPELHSYVTEKYVYYFTGNWIINDGTGRVIDFKHANFTGLLDTKQNKEGYALIPQYEPETRLYEIPIKIYFEDNGANHPSEITLSFHDAKGEYVTGARLSKPDEGQSYYTYIASVPYSESYQVVATATSYQGEKVSYYVDVDKNFSEIEIMMEHVGRDDCSCICHSFLKPIWVKILNLMNTLFKKKIVCCDDMYAEIGHLLNYSS